MELKIWLAVASMLLVFGIANGGQSIITCTAAVVGGLLDCTCERAADDVPGTDPDVTWEIGALSPPGCGSRKAVFVKYPTVPSDGTSMKCKNPPSTKSAATTAVVEAVKAPTITCTPAPNKVDVKTTCTCKPENKAPPISYKFTVAGVARSSQTTSTLQYTVVDGDDGKTIMCSVTFRPTVNSPASTTPVTMNFVKAQGKPTLEGTKEKSGEDLSVTCKAADAAETGLKYNWYQTKPDATTPTKLNACSATVSTYTLPITKQKNDTDGYKYQCEVVNTAGPSPKSDAKQVKYEKKDNGACNCESGAAEFLGLIFLLTTIVVKE